MNKRITVRLSKDLLDLAARKAAAEGRTLASLIEEGLRSVTAEDRTAGSSVKVLPRAGTVIGVSTHGADLVDQSAVQEPMLREPTPQESSLKEIDDLENVERIKPFKGRGRKNRA